MDRAGEEGFAAGAKPGLLRVLGLGPAIALVVGSVIGSGIFFKPGTIASQAGDFRMILAAWVIGGIVCMLGALSIAELAAMLPEAGGLYVYLREAYGRPVAFLFGFSEFLFNRTASTAALAVAFVSALLAATGWRTDMTTAVLVACAILAGIAWINILGVVWGAGLQTATTVIKGGTVAFLAVLPWIMFPFAHELELANYLSTAPPPVGSTFWGRFGVVFLAVLWAYDGWHQITPVTEEIREPQRNIPRALAIGMVILIALYVGATLAYHGVLTMAQVAAAGKQTPELMTERLLGGLGRTIVSSLIMCSAFGTISNNLLTAPRVPFAMGRDGVFFDQLGAVHAHYRTPAVAIFVQASLSVLMVVATGVLVTYVERFKDENPFDLLTNYVVFAAGIFYALSVLAVIVLRRQHPEWPRPYRTWGYPVVPALFLAFYAWFLLQVYLERPAEANTGLVLICLGLPVYFAFQARARRPTS